MAQTLVTNSPTFTPGSSGVGDDLTLDSVGSGSGLLDLTREADDTSLGAELLDEIYPDAGETGTGDAGMDTATGSSGVFDGSVTLEAKDASDMELPEAAEATAAGSSAASGVHATSEATVEESAQLDAAELPEATSGPVAMPTSAYDYVEGPFDPAGSGMASAFLFCTAAALVIGLIVAVSALAGVPNAITAAMSKDSSTLYIYTGVGAAVAVVIGVAGMFVGKALGK